MLSNSKVTAVIPCYNDGLYIKQALESLLNQTLLPERIIIVDDGSNLETKKILKTLSDPLVEIIFQENQGVAAARNNGITASTTDYILTLDADDTFEPSFIEKAVAVVKANSKLGVVNCFYKHFGFQADEKQIIRPLAKTPADFLVKNNGVASCLFRKKCWEDVGGYDPQFKLGYEDWDFWLAIIARGWGFYTLKESLFNYRKKKKSRDIIAQGQYDTYLRTLLFKKHKSIYLDHFESFALKMIERNATLSKTLKKKSNSIDARVGKHLLGPFRAIKKATKR